MLCRDFSVFFIVWIAGEGVYWRDYCGIRGEEMLRSQYSRYYGDDGNELAKMVGYLFRSRV